jgi:Major Facilitator Superfamily
LTSFIRLLRQNRNYRFTWLGQVVSEIGDHFNNIAVFSLAMETTHSGLVVSGVMIARAVPVILAGPFAGLALDRMDRKRVMIASDLLRAFVAFLFLWTATGDRTTLLYLLSGLLMFASPFFTSGRQAILPTIASREELHTANALTQTTQWTTLTIGTLCAGGAVALFGYEWAFVLNAVSFLFSAFAISRLHVPAGFRALKLALSDADVVRPWQEYKEGLLYMATNPLILGIALVGVGWATGGGAAQILFSLFGELVFARGAIGIGTLWAFAGLGLLAGAVFAHWLGTRISFKTYKRTVIWCYVLHGSAYVAFSQMREFWAALLFMALSRAAVAVSSVLNYSQLLRHVPDAYRGRVFATMESMTWGTMMLSLTAAGVASQTVSPRTIGVWAGILSGTTAIFWATANWTGRLPEPLVAGIDPDDIEVRVEVEAVG